MPQIRGHALAEGWGTVGVVKARWVIKQAVIPADPRRAKTEYFTLPPFLLLNLFSPRATNLSDHTAYIDNSDDSLPCRKRHIKCVIVPGTDDCKNCTQKKRTCVKGECYRFCPVVSVRFNAGENVGAAQQELEFADSQTWVHIPSTLRFLPPNTDEDDDGVISGSEEYPGSLNKDVNVESSGSDLSGASADRHRSLSFSEHHGASGSTGYFSTVLDSPSNIPAVLSEPADIIDTNSYPIGLSSSSFPPFSPSLPLGHPAIQADSPLVTTHSTFSQTSHFSSRWPVKSKHEARLFHHYIVHCSPWIDICDPKCHWAKEVPKRAAHFQVILNGVLALAARHLYIIGELAEDLSEPYVSDSLHTLILALEDPLAHWDENFLVAVILLRLHEEIGEMDERCHHLGASRIINASSSFAADGGLRESASWVSLRQHIYVSLTTQQPLDLSLGNYRCSSVFTESHDEAWANRIIFCFANILKHVFEHDSLGRLSQEKWIELDAEVEEWHNTKPWSFTPLAEDQFVDKSIDLGHAEWQGEWPELLTAHPAQADCTCWISKPSLKDRHRCGNQEAYAHDFWLRQIK
ncbi:hypothetical protein F4806DRAFT_496146 [Annulohypoxylon nitens]|nr:hypothetical protein F4806DRAFT_496146 [Annulohypoxylon nitens]